MPLDGGNRHGLGMGHQPLHHVLEERLHANTRAVRPQAAAVLDAFLIKLATVSVGCAPLLTQ